MRRARFRFLARRMRTCRVNRGRGGIFSSSRTLARGRRTARDEDRSHPEKTSGNSPSGSGTSRTTTFLRDFNARRRSIGNGKAGIRKGKRSQRGGNGGRRSSSLKKIFCTLSKDIDATASSWRKFRKGEKRPEPSPNPVCLLCSRKFQTTDGLRRHEQESALHAENVRRRHNTS